MSEKRMKLFAQVVMASATHGTYENEKKVFVVHEDNLMNLLSALSIATEGRLCEEIELLMEWSDDE